MRMANIKKNYREHLRSCFPRCISLVQMNSHKNSKKKERERENDNTKWCQECRIARNIIFANTKAKLQGMLENILEFPIKFDILLIRGSSILLLDISPKEVKNHVHTNSHLQIFIAILFIVSINRK